MQFITAHNPFDTQFSELTNIFISLSDNLNVMNVENAFEIGLKIQETFTDKPFKLVSLRKSDKAVTMKALHKGIVVDGETRSIDTYHLSDSIRYIGCF